MPWNYEGTPGIQIAFLYQLLGNMFNVPTNIFCSMFCLSLVYQVSVQFRALAKRIQKVSEVEPSKREETLRKCLIEHIEALAFAGRKYCDNFTISSATKFQMSLFSSSTTSCTFSNYCLRSFLRVLGISYWRWLWCTN